MNNDADQKVKMKTYTVEKTEVVRVTKTYRVEAESEADAIEALECDAAIQPIRVSTKQIDRDTDAWETPNE